MWHKKKVYKFRIDDLRNFKCGLCSFVETSVDYSDCTFDPKNLKTDYFGTIENGEFAVYHRKVNIEIFGRLVNDEITIYFNFSDRLNYLFDIVIFTIVGISIMLDIHVYLGLPIILFVFAQKFYFINNEEKIKNDFLEKFESTLNKK